MTNNYYALDGLLQRRKYASAIERLRTLSWKLNIAQYYARLATQAAKLLLLYSGKIEYTNDWDVQLGIEENHTITVALYLHHVGDISAQLVNDSILIDWHIHIKDEQEVSLSRICSQLEKRNDPDSQSLLRKVKEIKHCKEFQYIDAFVNTIKHRRLIQSAPIMGDLDDGQSFEGVIFDPFDFKKQSFNQVLSREIYNDYVDVIKAKVDSLIDELISQIKN